uniref:Uncharacterized protein n=1 Tax=Megaselia scalaris TaxID=36166 RepID=T1GD84_MEGSC
MNLRYLRNKSHLDHNCGSVSENRWEDSERLLPKCIRSLAMATYLDNFFTYIQIRHLSRRAKIAIVVRRRKKIKTSSQHPGRGNESFLLPRGVHFNRRTVNRKYLRRTAKICAAVEQPVPELLYLGYMTAENLRLSVCLTDIVECQLICTKFIP